jgi:hypothetical protein
MLGGDNFIGLPDATAPTSGHLRPRKGRKAHGALHVLSLPFRSKVPSGWCSSVSYILEIFFNFSFKIFKIFGLDVA